MGVAEEVVGCAGTPTGAEEAVQVRLRAATGRVQKYGFPAAIAVGELFACFFGVKEFRCLRCSLDWDHCQGDRLKLSQRLLHAGPGTLAMLHRLVVPAGEPAEDLSGPEEQRISNFKLLCVHAAIHGLADGLSPVGRRSVPAF